MNVARNLTAADGCWSSSRSAINYSSHKMEQERHKMHVFVHIDKINFHCLVFILMNMIRKKTFGTI